MNSILVIIPAYNEEENILKVIQELKQDVPYADILVINDCSKDNTLRILQDNNVNHLTTPFNLGYAGVVQTGFKYAVVHNYEYVAQFDGDGQHIAKELDRLIRYIQSKEVDIVIGSRFKEKTSIHFLEKWEQTFLKKSFSLYVSRRLQIQHQACKY